MRHCLVLLGVTIALASCSADPPQAEGNTDEAVPQPEPTADFSTAAPSPVTSDNPSPTPPDKDADGCVTIQLPGHFEGEGLAKHYVPGPTTRLCDPPAVIAPATAEPYAPPIAATPAD